MAESNASTLGASANAASPRVPALLFGVTILLSAFLLFQVQPLIAKLILPWFGGSAAVWTSCLLFFQLVLLAGYAWAHWLSDRSMRQQILLHGALLLVSLAALPILPSVRWKPAGGEDPLLGILGLLAATVGLPYFLLSATSPLLQSWYSRASGGAMPYRFFALSNAGSMAGLLTYPVFVEPNLTNRHQAWMWSAGFIAFIVCFLLVAFLTRTAHAAAPAVEESPDAPPPSLTDKLLWIGLAACGSALLLAVTNHLTQNVAAIPFLWVLPLSLYLLSFILCFDSDRWYRRRIFIPLAVIELVSTAYAMADNGDFTDLIVAVALFSAALFVFFMVCHGELARRRPPSRHLTSFYLMVSIGGALGGVLVGFIFPYVLPALVDLPIVLALTAFLFAWLLWREYPATAAIDDENFLNAPADKYFIAILMASAFGYLAARVLGAKFAGWPAFLAAPWDGPVLLTIGALFILYILWRSRGEVEPPDEKRDRIVMLVLLGALALFTGGRLFAARFFAAPAFPDDSRDLSIVGALAGLTFLFLLWRCRDTLNSNRIVAGAGVALAFGLTGFMAHNAWNYIAGARLTMRNFYGALTVYDYAAQNDWGPWRELRHGTIEHGEQFLWPRRERHATTYYAAQSGLGLALRSLRVDGPMNVGSIGLGAGTTAVYARPGDRYFFYDINPIVPFIANTQFSFLRRCYGKHEIILGDARLSLENELKSGTNRRFDLLSVDAFSGDAIPVHLLTREAFRIYWQHLRPDGVLAVHVSNRYLSLAPVVALAAAEFGKQAMDINYDGNDDEQETSSEWVLVTSRPGFFERDTIQPVAEKIEPIPGLREWTDDYSNLYKILR
jgi:hypothetical protein